MSDSGTEYDKLFIGGKWTKPSTSDVIEVRCPATGEYVGKVPMAAAADVDAAVVTAEGVEELGRAGVGVGESGASYLAGDAAAAATYGVVGG